MTNEQLAEIEARCEAATPGPWTMVEGELCGDPYFDVNAPSNAISGERLIVQTVVGDIRYPNLAAQDRANVLLCARARTDVPALTAAIREARERIAALEATWRCFNCGFETADLKEAEAHFGERDDAEEFRPLCRWWRSAPEAERIETLQQTIKDLSAEQDENTTLRVQLAARDAEVARLRSALGRLTNSCTDTLPDGSPCICEPEGGAMSQALAALAATAEPGTTEPLYYIQNKGYAGDCLLFWRHNRCGYTTNLDEALKLSRAEAEKLCSGRPGEDFMLPVDAVELVAHRHVNSEVLRAHAIEAAKPEGGRDA